MEMEIQQLINLLTIQLYLVNVVCGFELGYETRFGRFDGGPIEIQRFVLFLR